MHEALKCLAASGTMLLHWLQPCMLRVCEFLDLPVRRRIFSFRVLHLLYRILLTDSMADHAT